MPYSNPPSVLTESPPAIKISAMAAAVALTGAEIVPIVQGGANVRTTTLAIASLSTAIPGGANTQVQFNDSGAFNGQAGLTYTKASNLTTANTLTVSTGLLTVTPGNISTGAATNLNLQSSGGTQVRVFHVANTVNQLGLNGNSTTLPPQVGVLGSDTNIDLQLYTKGTGAIVGLTSSGARTQFKIAEFSGDPSIADVFTASGGTGNAYLQASGGTASINANIAVKAAGVFYVWKSPAGSGQPIFKAIPPAGTLANYLGVQAQVSGTNPGLFTFGTDAAVHMDLRPVGTNAYVQAIERGSLGQYGTRLYTTVAGGAVTPASGLDIIPSAAGANVILQVSGSGGNVGLKLIPGGTGSVSTEPGSGTTLTVASATATTVSLYDTVATTLTLGQAATSMTVGATTGTITFRNATQAHPNATAFIIGTDPGGANVLRVGGALTVNSTTMIATKTAFTNNAGVGAGTLTNAPAAGDPTKWIPIDDNGTIRNIPAW